MRHVKTIAILLLIIQVWGCSDEFLSPTSESGSVPFPSDDLESSEVYNEIVENPFINTDQESISTFSIDADGASYANVRRFLHDNSLPPRDAIRTEELINYFDLDYPFSGNNHPISINAEISTCPWETNHKLVRIGIKGEALPQGNLPPSNFVFLIDVSGSMSGEGRLELLKNGFKTFVEGLTAEDRVAIVTYAGSAGVALESTSGAEKDVITRAIDRLGAGGSTAGAEGIITAYEIAQQNFLDNGNNRIIIGTDGDFNVGISNQEELIELVEEKRDSGVFITVLGVGRGNLHDGPLEQIANNGNGVYEYIDNIEQLRKVFIYDYEKFYSVAKDVKVQVAFNTELVSSYRLIGYENRVLSNEDFEDDSKDAGEIGANQNITALYEIVPAEQIPTASSPSLTIDFRYKAPNSETSILIETEVFDQGTEFSESSDFMKFTSSIASFAMILRESEYAGNSDLDQVLTWLNSTNLRDEHGFKDQLKDLVRRAQNPQ